MVRSYFHARLLAAHAPNDMAIGSGVRVVVVAGVCFGPLALGWLSAETAAIALGLGFVFEALISGFALAKVVREREEPAQVEAADRKR